MAAESGANPGTHLRSVREQRGLSLHQVAVELHVSDFIIEALERGDYSVLGGAVFVRGHLRNYARTLGIAESEVLALYDQAQDRPTVPRLVTQHSTGMSPRVRDWYMRAATGGVVLVLLILAVSWWQRRPEEKVEPAAGQVEAAPLPASATTTTPVSLAPANNPAPIQTGAASLATPLAPPPVKAAPPRATHEERRPAVAAVQGPPAPTPAPTRQVIAGAGDAASLTHVVFSVSTASWIEVYDAAGKRLYYDLAPAGDTLDLSGAGPLQVFLGNAPGVSVQLNGEAFDIKQYSRADNTARFKLGAAGDTVN